jgi:hypothetical protein
VVAEWWTFASIGDITMAGVLHFIYLAGLVSAVLILNE